MRRSSEASLCDTRVRDQQLISAMHSAKPKMIPAINAFRDQVLFLKHNLNVRAIASLRLELVTIEDDISLLISDMEASIAQSDQFLTEMELL